MSCVTMSVKKIITLTFYTVLCKHTVVLFWQVPHCFNDLFKIKKIKLSEYSFSQDELYLLLERKLSYPWSLALNFKHDGFSSKDCFSSNDWHQQHKHDCTKQSHLLYIYICDIIWLSLYDWESWATFFPCSLILPLKNMWLHA